MAASRAETVRATTMRELGFSGPSVKGYFAPVSFSRSDCEVFQRYPHKVPYKDEFVSIYDQQIFRSIWQRTKGLAADLAGSARLVPDLPSMKGSRVPITQMADRRLISGAARFPRSFRTSRIRFR